MQLMVNIVVLAGIYALIGCGYALIYRVSRVLNMAHGELMMLGGYFLITTASHLGGHPLVAIGAALVLSVTIGVLIYQLLLRRLAGEMMLAALLTTIALGIFFRGIVILFWTAQELHPLQFLGWSNPSIALPGGARISGCALILLATTACVYIGLFGFLRFGRWGMRMRAVGQNPLLARQRGIDLNLIYALAWGLSTFTGSLAGILISLDSSLNSNVVVIGLKAFPAALVGGLDSLLGALVGALIVATAEVLSIRYIDPLLSDVVPFFVLIAMLVVRPWGLFGTREELDRV